MKLISNSFYVTWSIVMFACCGCPVKNSSSVAFAAETQPNKGSVERYYFIKGMRCGGCVVGVKSSLKKVGLDKSQILELDHTSPDPAHNIGHAKVKFPADRYKGKESDCKIAKQIRDDLGYMVYWEKSNLDPCGLDQDK